MRRVLTFILAALISASIGFAACEGTCHDDSGAKHPCSWAECGSCGEHGCRCPDGLPV